jgi:hypothetical protein
MKTLQEYDYEILYVQGKLNVVGTVRRSILGKSMVSCLLRTYRADKAIRKDFKNPEVSRFEKSLDGILYAAENGQKMLVVP